MWRAQPVATFLFKLGLRRVSPSRHGIDTISIQIDDTITILLAICHISEKTSLLDSTE